MNVLIDENLSPALVQLLATKGISAQHVAHIGLIGVPDPEVWRHAFELDQIVITVNAADFLRLAESVELHPGLIVVRDGSLSRAEQWAWIEPVIDWLIETDETLINKAVVVTGARRFGCIELPPP